MNITQIESNLQNLIKSLNKSSFIYDLLLAYGLPRASITRLQKGGMNLSNIEGEIIWKKKLFYKEGYGNDLHELIEKLKTDDRSEKHETRFLVVTDFKTLLARDLKTSDTLDIPIFEIPKHFDFFLQWAGMEKAGYKLDNPADVKAAVKMAKLYDEIKKDNLPRTPEEVHNLNVFLSRLLFCFYAEDTSIFEEKQFTNSIISHTQVDGSDLNSYLEKLFEVLNTESAIRKNLPAYLEAFPFVNGGLYKNKHNTPVFTRRSRSAIIECGGMQWRDINPDIFGSMIQAVITPEDRGGLGMHYTSVPNIMKVIEPLFLNELYEEFEEAKENSKKLNNLLNRIWNIKIFDPACGSGNFLIISYKELRRLEMKIFKENDRINKAHSAQFSGISLSNYFGVELDDFAHEIAILSLWLAEHQMNLLFFKEFGRTKPALPLKETGNIVHGNATRLDWEIVCPKKEKDEIFVLGNPPYKGSRNQDANQKADMKFTFNSDFKSLDYITCWFLKAGKYIHYSKAKIAFVSTNSICQGEQVALLWPNILKNSIEIFFAYQSFKWTNNAKDKAGVTVVIVGLRLVEKKEKRIYQNNKYTIVENINPYLTNSSSVNIIRRSKPLTIDLPKIVYGSLLNDDGNLTLDSAAKRELLKNYPESEKYIRKYVGADEFIKGKERWCFYILDKQLEDAKKIPEIKVRLDDITKHRAKSTEKSTRALAPFPNRFYFSSYNETPSIIIPRTSSENRLYIPIGFLSTDEIISDAAQAIYDARPWVFSVISSKMHMIWIRSVCGCLETRIRYSSALGYNTFPFPLTSLKQKQELERYVFCILEEREKHSEKTLAQLYDSDRMPKGLREAHQQNDLAVERCYRSKPFENDEDRLEYLFKLHEQMKAEEESKGTLFERETRIKKKLK